MWGLAWGALVFGELAHASSSHWMLVLVGSVVMILGALAVSTAVATEKENASMRQAVVRECARYELDYDRVSQLARQLIRLHPTHRPRLVGLRHHRRRHRRLHLARSQRAGPRPHA